MIFIAVKFSVRPEYSEEWLGHARTFTENTRQEPGNLWFEWSRSVDKPNEFILIEAFRDQEAGVEHVNSEHFKKAVRELPTFLAGDPDVINTEIPGTEWSKLVEMSAPA